MLRRSLFLVSADILIPIGFLSCVSSRFINTSAGLSTTGLLISSWLLHLAICFSGCSLKHLKSRSLLETSSKFENYGSFFLRYLSKLLWSRLIWLSRYRDGLILIIRWGCHPSSHSEWEVRTLFCLDMEDLKTLVAVLLDESILTPLLSQVCLV